MPTFETLLDSLRTLLPPVGVVYVGAGSGAGAARYAEWGVRRALLVDADAELQPRLEAAVSKHPGWSAHIALLAEKAGTADFYVATNRGESGVLPPDQLTAWWPKLKTRERREQETTTLTSLLTATSVKPGEVNWAIVDCLPALPVLRGAVEHLAEWDVVIVRAVLEPAALFQSGAHRDEIDAFLAEQGFLRAAVEEERHPAIGQALYVRQWKAAVHADRQQLAAACRAQAEVLSQVEALEKDVAARARERDEATRHCAEYAIQSERLASERDAQAKLAADARAELEQAGRERDENTRLASERLQQIEDLQRQRDEQANLAMDRLQQSERLVRERDEQTKAAAERHQKIEQLLRERDAQAKLVVDRQAEIEGLLSAKAQLEAERIKLKSELESVMKEKAQLSAAQAEQSKLAADRKTLLDGLNQTKAQLEQAVQERQKQVDALIKDKGTLQAARDEQAKLAAERLKRATQLETELNDVNARFGLLQEELIKAEGQIELVSDLLLREPSI